MRVSTRALLRRRMQAQGLGGKQAREQQEWCSKRFFFPRQEGRAQVPEWEKMHAK